MNGQPSSFTCCSATVFFFFFFSTIGLHDRRGSLKSQGTTIQTERYSVRSYHSGSKCYLSPFQLCAFHEDPGQIWAHCEPWERFLWAPRKSNT